MALKALNERLTKTVSPPWPSMEDDDVKLLPQTSSTQAVELTAKAAVDDLELPESTPTESHSAEEALGQLLSNL